MPYGDKSEEALLSYVTSITNYLADRKCKMIVVACNSAATVIQNAKELAYNSSHIVEVISPIVDLIATQPKYQNIGIIGTRKTIGSGMFNKELESRNKHLNITARATPVLVPIIEDGFLDREILYPVFDRYFKGFENCELIIPACTHYPIIYEQIESYFYHKLKVLHTPKIIAEEVERKLQQKGLLNEGLKESDTYHLSDVTDRFIIVAKSFLGKEVDFVKTLLDQ